MCDLPRETKMNDKDMLFQLKFREEELRERIKYCEKKRNTPSISFDKEIEWDCKRLDADNELETIRERIKQLES